MGLLSNCSGQQEANELWMNDFSVLLYYLTLHCGFGPCTENFFQVDATNFALIMPLWNIQLVRPLNMADLHLFLFCRIKVFLVYWYGATLLSSFFHLMWKNCVAGSDLVIPKIYFAFYEYSVYYKSTCMQSYTQSFQTVLFLTMCKITGGRSTTPHSLLSPTVNVFVDFFSFGLDRTFAFLRLSFKRSIDGGFTNTT